MFFFKSKQFYLHPDRRGGIRQDGHAHRGRTGPAARGARPQLHVLNTRGQRKRGRGAGQFGAVGAGDLPLADPDKRRLVRRPVGPDTFQCNRVEVE